MIGRGRVRNDRACPGAQRQARHGRESIRVADRIKARSASTSVDLALAGDDRRRASRQIQLRVIGGIGPGGKHRNLPGAASRGSSGVPPRASAAGTSW